MLTILPPEQIDEVFQLLQTTLPDPQIELDYQSPFTLAVAVILSAQTTDKSVNKVTPILFSIADTPETMAQLSEERLQKLIQNIGLYKNKARNIIKMSKELLERFNGELPRKFEDLTSLPGIGVKSANVLLNVLFGEDVIAVDTHVFRVCNRIGICRSKSPEKMSKELETIIPNRWKRYAHYALVLHGRYICTAKKPKCDVCILNRLCAYYQEQINQIK